MSDIHMELAAFGDVPTSLMCYASTTSFSSRMISSWASQPWISPEHSPSMQVRCCVLKRPSP